MNPAKIDPISIPAIREKGVESIVDWFDQNKQSFYILGWFYLRNQQQMEELFYQSIIKVHKELLRFKRETSFEKRVTSIFIETCRELSNNNSLQALEESEPRQELFRAFDELEEYEREALVLTYIKGLTQEEVSKLLQVSVEKLKEHLFCGIQSLRKGMGYGSHFNGCKKYHKSYIDYLETTLDRSKKVDFEIHMYHCQDCQEDFAAFRDVMLTMFNLTERMEDFHVPSDFMENIRARLAEKDKQRQLKNNKCKKMGILFASVVALLIGIEVFTKSFTNLYYTWTEEDKQLRTFLQHDLGERVNLKAESSGVKIRIKSAIADDVQTLVFYEIEDTDEDNQYVMDEDEGVSVENDFEIMNNEAFRRYYPPDLKSEVNNKEKNVYQGKISLLPIIKDKGTIKLKITKLRKLTRDSVDQNSSIDYENREYKTGEWNFEVPVTKQPSVEYALHKETEVEGIPVRFDKLTITPTVTILQYAINNKRSDKRIDFLNFDNLEVNNKKVKAEMYGSIFSDSQHDMNWMTFQSHFDPLFREKPKEINAQFDSARLTVEDQKNIELDASQEYPQTFEYAGSTISIDKVEVGEPTEVVISNREIKNRAYESLNLDLVDEDDNVESSMGIESQGVFVDKNGNEYDINITPYAYEEIEQPRYFDTVLKMTLSSNSPGEKVIPTRLKIYGYYTTKYMDDVVKISLKESGKK